MIEKIVLDYLAAALPVPVRMEVPEDAPAAFVVIEKVGSGARDQLDTASLAIQSYGGSLMEAAQLNSRVKGAMKDLDTLDPVVRCALSSDYHFPDTARKRHRYQAVFDLVYYEEESE